MLTIFSGKNYKAYDDFKLELKPLTVLLGANSCGKSALINSLLMFSQTVDSMSVSDSALRLNGPKVGMGEALNIIKNKDDSKTLSFSFDFSDNSVVKSRIDALRRETVESLFMFTRFTIQTIKNNDDLIKKMTDLINEVSDVFVSFDDIDDDKLDSISTTLCHVLTMFRNDGRDIVFSRSVPSNLRKFIYECPLKHVRDCLVKMLAISGNKLSASRISYDFKYDKFNGTMKVVRLVLFNKNHEKIIDISPRKNKVSVSSEVIPQGVFYGCQNDILELVNPYSLNVLTSTSGRSFHVFFMESYNPVVGFLSQVVSCSILMLSNMFDGENVNHVSPLRAFPQRYYLLDKTVNHSQLNSSDGSELAEILKKNTKITDSINLLLAEFNLAVDIVKVNDIIHKIVINQGSVNLELTDVGFGISQVLPVLVQAYLSPEGSITIIEQPEIHLHPKMQAWLTDALIKISMKEKKIFIIETHSDALVRRIRLRIVDESSELTEEQVAIYHLERDESGSSTLLNKVAVNSEGDITWPGEFMDVEIQDTIRIQELKVQKLMNSKGIH
ncbi:AAA family ATPase [Serratia marcescens]|uniref:AAA family ATPase n=2 Tax=Serratia TaxID=613 RepID=UPI001A2F3A11|nr:AAA family ATPase [Serratia marcescens]HEI9729225.1 AAA family ATPase [Serratia marcescens]HEI9759144.1 AAA family ATPase [Serratia marcescens]HEJ6937471.1 AAA family ATPase [Serratia marcescens]HEJ7844986.1 AAA family ATPase [Serratia marcescens]